MNERPDSPKPFGSPTSGKRRGGDSRPGWHWRSRNEVLYILAGLGALVLAGGGTPVWARGLVLAGAGLWLIMKPPAETPSRWFDAAVLAFVAVALLSSFLPAAWLGSPGWRIGAQKIGLVLPDTNAPSPWVAGEALAQLLAGLAWLYVWWNLRPDHQARKRALWGLATLAAALAIATVACQLLKLKYPLAPDSPIFTFFPNRNQSAMWFCLGGVTAFGLVLESLKRRPARAALAGLLVLACLLALVVSISRMALGLFALGTVLLVGLRSRRDAGHLLVRVLAPLAVLGASLLVFFGQDTLQRFHLGAGLEATDEGRLQIWRDTLTLVRAQPAGVGLGQFSDVFPQYRDYSSNYHSILHPDSDWFWVLGEMGWPGLLAAAAAVAALAAVLAGRAGRASGPYRHIASLGAGLFVLHSVVDVPAHRFGTWLLAAFLIALSAPDRPPTRCLVPRWLFRLEGLLLLGVGGAWLLTLAGYPTHTTYLEERTQARSEQALNRMDGDTTAALASHLIAVRPMLWWPYYDRARAEVDLLSDDPGALQDFRRDRFLNPTWSRPAYWEGFAWKDVNPLLAVAAWREALQRQDPSYDGMWRDIATWVAVMPNGTEYVSALSKIRPLVRYDYLLAQGPGTFLMEMADEIARDPLLARYTPAQRQMLIEHWATVDAANALAYVQQHPKLIPDGWLIELDALAASKGSGAALLRAREVLPAAPVPTTQGYDHDDDAQLRETFRQNPWDIGAGATLLNRQLAANDNAAALATAETLAAQQPAPAFVSWWRAELLARAGRDAEAWTALQPYLDYCRAHGLVAPPADDPGKKSN